MAKKSVYDQGFYRKPFWDTKDYGLEFDPVSVGLVAAAITVVITGLVFLGKLIFGKNKDIDRMWEDFEEEERQWEAAVQKWKDKLGDKDADLIEETLLKECRTTRDMLIWKGVFTGKDIRAFNAALETDIAKLAEFHTHMVTEVYNKLPDILKNVAGMKTVQKQLATNNVPNKGNGPEKMGLDEEKHNELVSKELDKYNKEIDEIMSNAEKKIVGSEDIFDFKNLDSFYKKLGGSDWEWVPRKAGDVTVESVIAEIDGHNKAWHALVKHLNEPADPDGSWLKNMHGFEKPTVATVFGGNAFTKHSKKIETKDVLAKMERIQKEFGSRFDKEGDKVKVKMAKDAINNIVGILKITSKVTQQCMDAQRFNGGLYKSYCNATIISAVSEGILHRAALQNVKPVTDEDKGKQTETKNK